jgi:RHS repeat-associated protein
VTWTGSSGTLSLSCNLGFKTINITIVQPLSPGTLSPSSQSINFGANTGTITGTAATGGATSPSYAYQWQKSLDNVNWTDTAGQTSLNLGPGPLYVTSYFRRKVTETTSSSVAYTSSVIVNVYPVLVASINPAVQTIASGGTPATLVANVTGGSGSYSYQWQSSPDKVTWTTVGSSSTYSPGALTSTMYYTLTVGSNGINAIANASVLIAKGVGRGIADPVKIDTVPLAKDSLRTTQYLADTFSTFHSIRNVLALKIVEETPKYIPGDFSATVVCKVEYGHTSTTLNTIDSIKLSVNYTKNGGNKYNELNYFTYTNAEFTRITVIRVDAPTTVNGISFDTKQVLLLTNTLAATRRFKMVDNKVPSLTISGLGSGVPDGVNVNWTLPANTNNNAVQLEWTWLPDDLRAGYMNGSAFDTVLLFKTNSTRIDLLGGAAAGSYNIPLLYGDIGKLYVHVRAVNFMPTGTRADGPWSGVQTLAFNGHNDSLNWQTITTYAEEGKRKTVIQYYDGSFRMRQTVTKDNSTQTTLLAETFYDAQGRAAVQVLPAPGINNIIAYTKNLNKFNSQADNTSALDYFDFSTASLGKYATVPMDTTRGANLYYSSGNPEKTATPYNQNIPAANGYAYSVTRYTPDATGRVMMQSEEGDSMQFKFGHTTRYYYGTPAQEELDALFGTEAGNFTHYSKNMVQDANGLVSIKYQDMHGRTVATALAGQAPASLAALNISDTSQYKNQAGKVMTRNLLDKGSNILKGTSIESINTVLVPFPTLYTFNYTLSKQSLQLPVCTGGNATYPCKFNLTIDIREESDTSSVASYSYTGIDTINFQNSIVLPVGSYSVRKTLTINQDSLAKFLQQYDTANVGICRTVQALTDSIAAGDSLTSGCSIASTPLTCSSCLASLGNYTTYLSNYATSLGTTVAQLSSSQLADLRSQYVNDSSFCVAINTNGSHTLEDIRRMMTADMVPYSGQYADSTGSGTMYNAYNIFSPSGNSHFTQPFYKHPLNEAQTADYYYSQLGIVDSSVLSGTLASMTMPGFEQVFVNSWASSLLPYHPEFKKLQYAENNLRSSYNFIDSLNQTVSTAFSPTNADPFFSSLSTGADRDSIRKFSDTSWQNGYSLWQLAYGDAFGCKLMADTLNRNPCYANMPKTVATLGTVVNTVVANVSLTSAIQLQAWNVFKSLYSMVRGDMVNRYINLHTDTIDNTNLVNQNYHIYFPYSNAQGAKNSGFSTWYPSQAGVYPSVSLPDSVKADGNHCDGYINQWRLVLLQCPALTTRVPDSLTRENVVASITSRMDQVCKYGTDGGNPFGSSTVAPAYAGTTYTSFEQVVNLVFDSLGIPRGLFCSPYGIEYPKPYGLNPVITKQYIGSVDTCNCSQWANLKNKIFCAGYSGDTLSSVNAYLWLNYKDTITTALFQALQNCNGQYYLTNKRYVNDTCFDKLHGAYPCLLPIFDTLRSIPLPTPQPLPQFLDCGFSSSSYSCYSCTNFKYWDSTFYTIFHVHPVFTGTITVDSIVAYNSLFAQYVNFKTGMQHSWQFYADTLNHTGCPIGGIVGTGSGLSVCLNPTVPVNDTTGLIQPVTPCQRVRNNATVKAQNIYDAIQQQVLANFQSAYQAKCLAVGEIFKVTDTVKEYHYTLYYFDLAGNLTKTVPPKGVNPNYAQTWINSVDTARQNGNGTQLVPVHNFISRYCYNSLNHVNIEKTPDGGVSKFWYDRLGRLAASQNAVQAGLGNVYSYSFYDSIGRIIQVGQITGGSAMSDATAKSDASLQAWFSSASNSRNQITQTVYDTAYSPISGLYLTQQNLRKRVSYLQLINNATDQYAASTIFFSYDIHGNIDTLLQDFGNSSGIQNAMNSSGNRFKKIVYDYDLVSGKVNQVSYQPGQLDAYYHRYVYDAENRLTDVFAGRDSTILLLFPERDAHYIYYKHGPQARTELGQLRVQGLDYAYTLQGWVKGINPTMGGSLANGIDTTEPFPVAQDVFGISLHYYPGDYRAIGYSLQPTSVLGALGGSAAPLYNGNIAAMAVNIPKLSATKLYNYHYDQLNRLVAMDMYNGLSPVAGTFTPVNDTSYKERVSYDPNGNILTYSRNGDLSRPSMDNLSYSYTPSTNRLQKVTDAAVDASPGNYSLYNDVKQGQGDNNYQYDANGNLVANVNEGITNVTWNVYGKIASLTKGGNVTRYIYDAAGNRIMKQTITDTTIYVRDATGNVVSVYVKKAGQSIALTESHLYGSSRLGMATQHNVPDTSVALNGGFGVGIKSTFTRGEKILELSNHLSNVLVTITDRRIQVSAGGITVDSYAADVMSATDYYPFGMPMPGRNYQSGNYAYGYGGKRKDNEFYGEGNAYDFGERIQDPRLGRWLSLDKLQAKYPSLSPFAYCANTPISAHDPDGRLIIFIGGLRLWHASFDQDKTFGGGKIHNTDVYQYWSTDKNTFGKKVDMAKMFMDRINDHNAYYTSGSSQWDSQAGDRYDEGKVKAETFHAMVKSGKITLAKDETIKVICHSQGGAHASGFVDQLKSYKDKDGKPLYKIEVIYYITPHQPTDITNPSGVKGVQYSHPGDAVASDAPWWMPNGGTKFGKIKGISEFDGRDIIGGPGQPKNTGASGNRGGHNVTDNEFIFDIKPGQPGYVEPRKDAPTTATTNKKPGS